MDAINFRNFIKIKNIINIEKELNSKSNELLVKLKDNIESYISKDTWGIDKKETEVKVGKTKRGKIFIEKLGKSYKIGIEYFNPNFDNSKLRPDNIFCGKIDNKEVWSEQKYISDYKGVEMKTNSMEYVNLLLTEDIDKLVCHFFEEFKTYFDKNK